MMRKRSLKPSEFDEQRTVIAWANLFAPQIPDLKLLLHIPNGGYRNKIEAARFKALGVSRGVPDLLLPVARGGKHSLWIEMKSTGGYVTRDQSAWILALESHGHAVRVCIGANDAIETIQRYLRGEWV